MHHLTLATYATRKASTKEASAGIIEDFTGIGSPHEKLLSPKIVVNTSDSSTEQCLDVIVGALKL